MLSKKQLRGFNNFISPHRYFEFQIDLFFMNDLENQKFKVGMVIIDTFSGYAVVVPIESKSEGDVASGLIEGLNKFDEKPQIIYSDDEKALSTDAMQKYFQEQNLEHHITRGTQISVRDLSEHLRICFVKELKPMKKRVKKTYNGLNNHMKHSSIGLTPPEALKSKNELKAKSNMAIQATRTRKYPEISRY